MRDTVYFLVFDGYADWQAALALCELLLAQRSLARQVNRLE